MGDKEIGTKKKDSLSVNKMNKKKRQRERERE
jgi:hypothetical protein